MDLDMSRVKEILATEDDMNVHYHGIPVWIENIEESTCMAFVSQRGTHDVKRLVPIDSLEEN